jgi:ribosomal protein RSM22 (predicted rRNA methylase)
LEAAFNATEKYLVIISPGTSSLFQDYLLWRQFLVERGGTIFAPCPMNGSCPMSTLPGRWCHFKARVNRTKELKYLKDASMSFEDEPYSYIIISKSAGKPARESYRIIDHPQHRKGHSHFEVCAGEAIATITCSAKDPDYKHKKKLAWGDELF